MLPNVIDHLVQEEQNSFSSRAGNQLTTSKKIIQIPSEGSCCGCTLQSCLGHNRWLCEGEVALQCPSAGNR